MTLHSWNQTGGEANVQRGGMMVAENPRQQHCLQMRKYCRDLHEDNLNSSALKAIFEAIASISNSVPGSKEELQHPLAVGLRDISMSPHVGMLLLHCFLTSQPQRMRRNNICFKLIELH